MSDPVPMSDPLRTTLGVLQEALPNVVVKRLEPATLLREELGMDSLGLVYLIARVEQTLGIVVDEAMLEPENLRTIGDIEGLFAAKRQKVDGE